MKNPIRVLVAKRKLGIRCGIPSFCCANKLVIEAILDQAQRFDDTVLIEATSNQVNQYRGYTGMLPSEFRDFMYYIADGIGFDRDRIILGGDHLGPLPWADKPASEAMKEAVELVRLSVEAGYQKIHLDTSMRLGDDPVDRPLDDTVIAERCAHLYRICEATYKKLLKVNPNAAHPVFVIGSEVPISGGYRAKDDTVKVTHPEEFERTLMTYHQVFEKEGLEEAWKHIIAVVVQLGVEFGNHTIHNYSRVDSHELCSTLSKYPDIVFEGHSTDFQTPARLKEMVQDGVAIIKVGPALSYALREALFALSKIEEELIPDVGKRSNFPAVLDKSMCDDPREWQKYYHSTGIDLVLERKYSYSDRCRYYFTRPEVDAAINKLLENLSAVNIPLGLLHQYMPLQYIKVRDGRLKPTPKELAKDGVVMLVEDYNYAVKYNYFTSGVFID